MLLVICSVTKIGFPYHVLLNFLLIDILLMQDGVTKKRKRQERKPTRQAD